MEELCFSHLSSPSKALSLCWFLPFCRGSAHSCLVLVFSALRDGARMFSRAAATAVSLAVARALCSSASPTPHCPSKLPSCCSAEGRVRRAAWFMMSPLHLFFTSSISQSLDASRKRTPQHYAQLRHWKALCVLGFSTFTRPNHRAWRNNGQSGVPATSSWRQSPSGTF